MLLTFAILLVFQCLGEGLVFLLHLPLPGPVTGMLLLFVALLASPRLHALVEPAGNDLLKHLSLLFVPAGVGIVVAGSAIASSWLALLVSMAGGTLVTLAVTAAVMRALMPDE